MPYRRTSSSLFASAATAATTAALAATGAVVSAATVLALAAPAASAAPIPLPHYRSVDGVTGAGHHASAGDRQRPAGDRTPDAPHNSAGHRAPDVPRDPAGHDASADPSDPARHRPMGDQDATAPQYPAPASVDHLTLTVRGTGSPRTDGTFELYCHPARGSHPHAKKACEKLDGMTRWGRDPFAPVPQGANCTMIYGGPATAHITGTWAGRPVNADFRRTNGCEIGRWSSFEPLLPSTRS
ncbi:SSI family serine proteinase inhibitor [Streptomyces tubercidicus]|uniref:SSI family serine proteinase inhibitor n=1 Tax=Streptomyces tubercidicus TaxID=47759 RepID=UPI0036B32540